MKYSFLILLTVLTSNVFAEEVIKHLEYRGQVLEVRLGYDFDSEKLENITVLPILPVSAKLKFDPGLKEYLLSSDGCNKYEARLEETEKLYRSLRGRALTDEEMERMRERASDQIFSLGVRRNLSLQLNDFNPFEEEFSEFLRESLELGSGRIPMPNRNANTFNYKIEYEIEEGSLLRFYTLREQESLKEELSKELDKQMHKVIYNRYNYHRQYGVFPAALQCDLLSGKLKLKISVDYSLNPVVRDVFMVEENMISRILTGLNRNNQTFGGRHKSEFMAGVLVGYTLNSEGIDTSLLYNEHNYSIFRLQGLFKSFFTNNEESYVLRPDRSSTSKEIQIHSRVVNWIHERSKTIEYQIEVE